MTNNPTLNQSDDGPSGRIQIFNNSQFGTIRVSGNSESPIFCAADICSALGYTNGRKAVADHCDSGDVTKRDTPTASGIQQMTYVNESGMYALIFGSKLDKAKEFKKWVTSEVLPAIRRTGGYIAASPEESEADIMAKALVIAQRTIADRQQRIQMLEGERDILQSENRRLAPKAQYTDDVLQSSSTYTFTEVAKELNIRSGRKFLDECIERHIIFRQSDRYLPMARYADKGLFASRTARFFRSDGTPDSSVSTVITEAGRAFFHKIFSQNQ